jgi:hypothetical protein
MEHVSTGESGFAAGTALRKRPRQALAIHASATFLDLTPFNFFAMGRNPENIKGIPVVQLRHV